MKRLMAICISSVLVICALSACGKKDAGNVFEESESQAEVVEESSEVPESSEESSVEESSAEESSVQESSVEESESEAPEDDSSREEAAGIGEEDQSAELVQTSDNEFEIWDTEEMENAPVLEMNRKYLVRHEGGSRFIAFTTGAQNGESYTITLENLTEDSKDVYAILLDADGNDIKPTEKNNGHNPISGKNIPFCVAGPRGLVSTGMSNELEPNTTYYLRLDCGPACDLVLKVAAPSMETAVAETADTEAGAFNPLLDKLAIEPGASQSTAIPLPLNTTVMDASPYGRVYFAFTTSEEPGKEYKFTVVNCTVGSKDIFGRVCDAFGNAVDPTERDNDYYSYSIITPLCIAGSSGTANTGMINTLDPGTTYYVYLDIEVGTTYALRISTQDEAEDEAFPTSSTFASAKAPLEEDDPFYTGSNQTVATMLQPNIRYYGTCSENHDWVAFTTDAAESLPYTFTAQNLTKGSDYIHVDVIDEYGRALEPAERENTYYAHSVDIPFCYPSDDGKENSGISEPLHPNTTYYIRINGAAGTDFMLLIGPPEKEEPVEEEEQPENDLIFQEAFELNETQVRFVGDEAIFIDEEAAREALKPVAEILLAHPDHPVLIAGTTATVGTQESCVNLSDRRAAAVKDLLVKEYGVPADQLLTIGLGYADDIFKRGKDIDSNGRFVETEGAKNRRVLVLDANDERAQKVLEKRS